MPKIDIDAVLTALASASPTGSDASASILAAQIAAEIAAAEQPEVSPPEVKTPEVATPERETIDGPAVDMSDDDLDLSTDPPETSGYPLPFYGVEHTTRLRLTSVHSHTTEKGWRGVVVEGIVMMSNAFEVGSKRCIPWTEFAAYADRIHERVDLDEPAKKRILNNEKLRRRTFWAALAPTPVEPLSPEFRPELLASALAKAGRDGLLEQQPHDVVIRVTSRGHRKGSGNPYYAVEFLRPEVLQ